MGGDSFQICIGGSPVDSEGVCIEHGATTCVTTAVSEWPDEAPQAIVDDIGQRLIVAQARRRTAADS